MANYDDLNKRLIDLQNHYRFTLLGSKQYTELKSIKNNIKKLHHQLHLLDLQKQA